MIKIILIFKNPANNKDIPKGLTPPFYVNFYIVYATYLDIYSTLGSSSYDNLKL